MAVPSGPVVWSNTGVFRLLLGCCRSLSEIGRALAWVVFNVPQYGSEGEAVAALRMVVLGRSRVATAVHRPRGLRPRGLFPLPLGEVSHVQDEALKATAEDFCSPDRPKVTGDAAWKALNILALNGLAGYGRASTGKAGSQMQQLAMKAVQNTCSHALREEFELERSSKAAEKELAGRFVSYTGEEVPKMQVLKLKQVEAALPPVSHGGSIDALELACHGTREFLLRPEDSLLKEPLGEQKLQARVHMDRDEQLELCQLLVERNICGWIAEQEVLRVGGVKVLNGLFAVGKGSFLASGKEVQRLIMNLKPSNSVLKQLQGATGDLPSISQYLSLVMTGTDRIEVHQSDMSSAFYLFRLPLPWFPYLSFNIGFDGARVGLQHGTFYHLCCKVIPMGWGSAVAIMQEIADRLTQIGQLPRSHQVRRRSPLPPWLVESLDKGEAQGRSWFHVYLDNFCAMERLQGDDVRAEGPLLHRQLEDSWGSMGVLSSAKKRVINALQALELGAEIDGANGFLGPSTERLLKLIQTTLVVLSKKTLRKKWVQVVTGRWVHILTFRRPGMIFFDAIWKFVAQETYCVGLEMKARSELFGVCMAATLFRTNLKASVSEVTTASDASSSGGAVGQSRSLTTAGMSFTCADRAGNSGGIIIPVLVLSLFNGVGCCFRCYDLCGVTPRVAIAYDVSPEANRVTSRRWPFVQVKKDVRELTMEEMREWKYLYPDLEEIHVWGGFPCTDLSSAKWGRANLDGEASGLFYELVRILKDLKKILGFTFKIIYGIENVASMDAEAEQQITATLGVKPWLFDPCDAVPIHRPRYCWSNAELQPMEGMTVEEHPRWLRIRLEHAYPEMEQWVEKGAVWPGGKEGYILPTAMKSIKRCRPPPRPAGLERSSFDTQQRWEADSFRFPPYQYRDEFIFWVGRKWRLASASERELLHGMGYEHTVLCWNAGDIKRDLQGFEDARKSLVGDSFNCYSFSFVAAMMTWKFQPVNHYHLLWNRMGMAPGFCCPLEIACPLQRDLCYGPVQGVQLIQDLHKSLLRRVNHTGSDVRVSTGMVFNPKSFPRQSVPSGWWNWGKVFACKWARQDHINSLELRSILHSLQWRVGHLKELQCRIFHLTDSYICMSIISKGRTSSRMLQPLLQRLAATLLAMDIYLVICHVESTDNPTDHDSRL